MENQVNPFGDFESADNSNSVPIQLSAAQFLGLDENVSGYFTPDEMLDYAKIISPHYFRLLLQCMKEKRTLLKRSRQMKSEQIGSYIYYTFRKPKGTPGITVPENPAIERFIADYEDGLIEPTFDMDELARVTRENLSRKG